MLIEYISIITFSRVMHLRFTSEREYRATDGSTDCFSPATSSSILKILPVVAVNARKSLVTLDLKDAFLLVDQIELVACRFPAEFVELMRISQEDAKKFAWIVWKVLPGQRNAAALWAKHLACDLVSLSFSRCPLAPSMYKDKDGTLLIVHVDDVQGMGNEYCLRNLVTALKKKYVVSLEGLFLLAEDYARGYSLDTIKFLKRKFSDFNHRLSICIDPKYIQKLEELFRLTHRKPKAAPCGNDILKVDSHPVYLDAEDHRKYRTAIGILLYISGDRPDIQFAVNVLSSGLTAPTKRQQKQLEHLILYLTGTRDFHYVFPGKAVGTSVLRLKANNTVPDGDDDDDDDDDDDPESSREAEEARHLLEVFTDGTWASCHGTRRSASCAVLALNGSVVYSYSRRQKVVSLSSGEAEYYAAASGASEGVYLKNIVQFLTGKPVRLVLRCDSQAARGMIQRQGVQGRVKHISLKVLWLQDLCQSGILSITAVQTRYNLADIGTKSWTASRVRFLLSLFRFFTGNPDSHEAAGLQEQAEQLDIEALQVLRALCRDSEFYRDDRSVLRSLVELRAWLKQQQQVLQQQSYQELEHC